MTTLPKNPVEIDLHVGDDTPNSADLSCRCTQNGMVVEPIKVYEKTKKEDGLKFRLRNRAYDFVGFLSPQDRKHDCFEVKQIMRDDDDYSVMTVADKFCPTESLFDYELVFRDNKKHQGNLYRYDPQIKNEN